MMATPSANQLPCVGPLLDHREGAIMACDTDRRAIREAKARIIGYLVNPPRCQRAQAR